MFGSMRLGLGLSPTKGGGDVDHIARFLAGTTGADYNFSLLEQMYQESTAQTAASAGQPIGLYLENTQWAGMDLAGVTAAATELFPEGAFDSATGLTLSGVSVTGGKLVASSAANGSGMQRGNSLTVGDFYYARFTVDSISAGAVRFYDSVSVGPNRTVPGTYASIHKAAALVAGIQCAGTTTAEIDNLSVKKIKGSHANQATANSRPTLDLTGGRYAAKFDGTADNLLGVYKAGAGENSVIIDYEVPATISATQWVVGTSGAGTTSRLAVGFNNSGNLVASVGADDETVIFGGTDWRGTRCIGAVTCDGDTVTLLTGSGEEYSDDQIGTPGTTIPIMLGALNSNGTAASFCAGYLRRAIIAQKVLSLAEFGKIRRQLLNGETDGTPPDALVFMGSVLTLNNELILMGA